MSKKILNRLEQYADIGYNVLLIGDSGVGKTAMIEEIFNSKFKNWKYFNGATMNPWVDFVGVPDRTKDEDTGLTYLTMVQQKDFATDQVEAIFMDELNRAKDKTRNAIMELIQFKSINGKKFNNLKLIWAAINEGEDYDVERLDKATKDRFQIQISIPYEPSNDYFQGKYDDIGIKAISWWNQLDSKARYNVSPRRLENAIQHFQRGLLLSDVLSDITSQEINQFKNILKTHSPLTVSEDIFNHGYNKKAEKTLKESDFFNSVFMNEKNLKDKIEKHGESWLIFWVPKIQNENFIRLLENSVVVRQYIFKNVMDYSQYLLDYYQVNRNKTKLGQRIHQQMIKDPIFNQYIESKLTDF